MVAQSADDLEARRAYRIKQSQRGIFRLASAKSDRLLGYPGRYAPPLTRPEAQPPIGGPAPPIPVLPPPPESADTPPYTGQ